MNNKVILCKSTYFNVGMTVGIFPTIEQFIVILCKIMKGHQVGKSFTGFE